MLSTKTRTDTLTKTRANPLKALNRISELGVLASLVVVCVAFTILTDGQFATAGNAAALLAQAAELGIVAIGIAFILISGEIDLSVGSVYGMSALFFVFFLKPGRQRSILLHCLGGGLPGGPLQWADHPKDRGSFTHRHARDADVCQGDYLFYDAGVHSEHSY